MKKTDTPPKDQNLQNLLSDFEVPGLPMDFSRSVMEAVKELRVQYGRHELKIPVAIKIGIPVFLLVCLSFILIFPGNQQDPVNLFLNNFSGSSFFNFFDEISVSIQSLQMPDISISREAVYYILGGIGLVWMYILFESFSRRINKKNPIS